MKGKKHATLATHVLIGALLVCLVCVAMPAISASEAPSSIKIGAAMPVTGRFASGGHTVKLGYEIAVDFINKSGGVFVKEYGKKIPLELIVLDDESDPVKTVSKMETLNDTDHVIAYLGGFGSSLHAAAAGVAEKNKIPYLGVAFTLYSIHQQGYKYLFSPYPKTPNSIKTLFEMLDTVPADQRPTKMAIFRLTTDWGIEQAEAIHKMAPPEYKVVMDMKYRPLTKDFSAMILKAKAAGADSLWSNPIPPDGIALMKQCKELDWNPKFLYVVRASTYSNWIKALGTAGNYAICDSPYHWSYPFKGNAEFVAEFEKRDKALPDTTAGAGYVCVQVLANAIEKVGVLDRQKLRDAIAATDMETIMGPISFEADGTPKMYGPDGKILAIGGMSQWIKEKQELVWPPNLATTPFAYPAKPFNER
jgi:branched-chain amino acid transport system substrate-binding protein